MEALNDRKLKITMPEAPLIHCRQRNPISSETSTNIAERDALQKQKMKINFMLTGKRVLKTDKLLQETSSLLDNPSKINWVHRITQNLLLWKRRKAQWLQCETDPTLLQEIRPTSFVPEYSKTGKKKSRGDDDSLTPVFPPEPSDSAEDTLLRQSQRQIKPLVRFSDYVRVVYIKSLR